MIKLTSSIFLIFTTAMAHIFACLDTVTRCSIGFVFDDPGEGGNRREKSFEVENY